MPAGETAGLGGGAQGVGLWWGSPTHFQIPPLLAGDLRLWQKVTSEVRDGGLPATPSPGAQSGAGNAPSHDGLGA